MEDLDRVVHAILEVTDQDVDPACQLNPFTPRETPRKSFQAPIKEFPSAFGRLAPKVAQFHRAFDHRLRQASRRTS